MCGRALGLLTLLTRRHKHKRSRQRGQEGGAGALDWVTGPDPPWAGDWGRGWLRPSEKAYHASKPLLGGEIYL